MFKSTIVLSLCLLLSSIAFSQITFDYSKMQYQSGSTATTKIDPVRNGEVTILKIKNINTFLYKVEIEGKQIELQTPIPSELQRLFRLSPEELDPEAKKANEAEELVNKATGSIEQTLAPEKNSLNTLRKDRTAEVNNLISAQNVDEMNDIQTTIASIETSIKALEPVEDLLNSINNYKSDLKLIVEKISELKKARVDLIILAQSDYSFAEMSTELGNVSVPSESTVKTLYQQYESAYMSVSLLSARASDNEEVKKDLERLNQAYETIKAYDVLSIISDVNVLQHGLENPKNFEVTSPPFQMKGDMVSYSVSVTPTQTNNKAPYKHPKKWQLEIPAKSGWKTDFSVGPVLSFGKNAKDDQFYTSETSLVDTVLLQQGENNNAISPSIAAMMHFYPRTGKYAAYGFNFGVGAGFQTINDVDLSLFLGGSIILGQSRKIMISGGLSYLRVDRLKTPEFVPDTQYNVNQLDLESITEKVFRPSMYLSISFSLTNRVEIN